MPHRETDIGDRLDNLESTAYDQLYVGPDGMALSDILPTDLELESVTPGAGGAFVILSWMGWQPEVETYEIWLERPDEPAEKIGEFETSPATLTIAVEEPTPVVLTVRARAGDRTVGFAQSPSVAVLIPAPITSGDPGPNSIGDSHLIHVGENRIVITDADILNLNANKINAGVIDAGIVNVININADNINAGSINALLVNIFNLNADSIIAGTINAALINVTNLNASNIVAGSLSANRISGGTISGNNVNVTNLDAGNITTGSLSANRISGGTIRGSQYELVSSNENMLVTGQLGFRQSNDINDKYVSILGGRVYLGITIGTVNHDLVKIDSNEPIPDYSADVGSVSIFNINDQPKLYLGGDVDGLGGQISGFIQHNNATPTTFQLVASHAALFLGRENVIAGRLLLSSGGPLGVGGGELLGHAGGIECYATLLPQHNLRNLGSAAKRWGTVYAESVDVPTETPNVAGFFSAGSTSITPGESTLLFWTTSHAISGSIDQGIGNISQADLASGSILVTPAQTTTYTLTLQGTGGPIEYMVEIMVGSTMTNQPSITSFAPDDSALSTTQTTTVRWELVNVVNGTLSGTGLNRNLTTSELVSGSASIGPLSVGNHNYELVVNGEAGTTAATRSFTVVVAAAPTPDPVTIDSFTVDDSTIEAGESTILRWSTSNADSVTLKTGSNSPVVVSNDGTLTVSPTGDTGYTLRATGVGGPVSRTVQLDVTLLPSDPEVVSFSASSTSIDSGGSVVISWVTRNGDTRRLYRSNPDGTNLTSISVSASGSRTYTLTDDTTFQIQVWNASDPVGSLDSAFITVSVTQPPASIDSFSASDSTPDPNESFTLSWSTTGATHVRLRRAAGSGGPAQYSYVGGNRPADGDYVTSLTAGLVRSYRIRAFNSDGNYTESSTIVIRTELT